MQTRSRDFLHDLLTTPSPSGFERELGRRWRAYLSDVVDSVDVDVMGNVVAEVKGRRKGPRILLTAHTDEIGLMVTRVGDEGLLRFRNVGGIVMEVLPGTAVDVLPNGGPERIPGVLGWNAFARTAQGPAKAEELHIDIGARSGEEARALVKPGDPVVFASAPRYLQNGRLAARAIDDKIGCFVIAEVARAYAAKPGAATLVLAATAMEEIGGHGANVLPYDRGFAAALAVDTTYDTTLPGVDPDVWGAHGLGDGPVLAVGGTVAPKLLELCEDVARRLKIPWQREVCTARTLTDADLLMLNQRGLPFEVVMITTRNPHTPWEVVDLQDVEHTIRLLTEVLRALPADLDLRRL